MRADTSIGRDDGFLSISLLTITTGLSVLNEWSNGILSLHDLDGVPRRLSKCPFNTGDAYAPRPAPLIRLIRAVQRPSFEVQIVQIDLHSVS